MEVIYFNQTIKEFLDKLVGLHQTSIYRAMAMVERYGHMVGLPFSRPLGGGLFELRGKGSIHVRLLHCFRHDCVYILHGFIKKSTRIHTSDLLIAKSRMGQLDGK